LINDGHILLTLSGGFSDTPPLLFDTVARTFEPMWSAPGNGIGFASGDRGTILYSGDSGNNSARYDASTYTWTPLLSAAINSAYGSLPSANTIGTRFQSGAGVYDQNMNVLGYALNDVGVANIAAVINREGTRLYAYASTGVLRTYDLTLPATGGGQFPGLVEAGNPIQLVPNPGGDSSPPPQMAITPDGKTVFIGGVDGVAIQPTPP
jgi:hypothetical protein